MKRLVLHEPRRLRWEHAPDPVLGSSEGAIVRPVAAATCDFDHLLVDGRMALPLPIPIGHEFVAEVVELGSAVVSLRPGDVVSVPFQVSCGTCDNCQRGQTTACLSVPWLSAYGLGGLGGDWGNAVADLVAVPWADAMLRKLPAGVRPDVAAAASCNLPDAYRAVAPQLRARPGSKVFVTGGAFANISHYSVVLARLLGAETVDYFSVDDAQSAKAERLGARVLGSAGEIAPEAYAITVDNSQDPALLALAIRATAAGGELTSTVMYPDSRTPVPLMDMFARAITFRTGQPHVSATHSDVLDLLAGGGLDVSGVTTAVMGWDDAPEAFASGGGKTVCVRH